MSPDDVVAGKTSVELVEEVLAEWPDDQRVAGAVVEALVQAGRLIPTRWEDITPAAALELDLDLSKRLDITAPRDEQGERCPWPWDPQQRGGQPIGQYHCPYCGSMVLAGVAHVDYGEGGELASPDGMCLYLDVSGGVVRLAQTSGRTLRLVVNGVWSEAPNREKVVVEFDRPAEPAPAARGEEGS